jgi:bifunctional UDP-N-acetylglucosamine pyrophosphorylase/glucosamine-1-phosphate N-acetyltransferase
MRLLAVVLAAGQGTRMKSEKAKVLHTAAGRTLLGWVLDAIGGLGPDRTVVVVGHEGDQVAAALPNGIDSVVQMERLGTGDAVRVAVEALGPLSDTDTVLIVYGDMPLITADLLDRTRAARADRAAAMVTVNHPNPFGYGRIVRDRDGGFDRVIEEADATPTERHITEVNAGVYAFAGDRLTVALGKLSAHNSAGEYYLPDVLPVMIDLGGEVAIVSAQPDEVLGVNSQGQLAAAEAALRRRINHRWQSEDVWMQDPDRVYIDAGVSLAGGVRIYPGVHLEGSTTVAEGAVIGPEVFALDSSIAASARVWYSVLRSAQVGPGAEVGPYASLRPGTVLKADSKAGSFVEMKNTTIGEGAKVPHLSYLGDATVGARSNIGAGTITCNYDGYDKHSTTIGEDAFIGSDTMLVAPVVIGDRAFTGAGSVITNDVEPGALAVERSAQVEIPGYAARKGKRHRGSPEGD